MSDPVADVLDRLGSHDPTAERAAVRALVRLGRRHVPELRAASRSHRNAHARYVALLALERIIGRDATRDVLRALVDPATPVRQHAVMILSRTAWTPTAAARVTGALSDPSPGVRHFAAVVAGRRRIRAALPRLIAALRDPVWHVRQQAAVALGEIGATRSVTALLRATHDGRPAVRLAARAALEKLSR